MDTVIESMFIANSDGKSLYGKTGNRQSLMYINVDTAGSSDTLTSNDNDYFFATNISLSENDNQFLSADGLSAFEDLSVSTARSWNICL